MPTTFANTIDGNEILAKRAECDYAGNDIQTTYATKSEVTTGLSGKQDTISDLSDIRAGAADGATAVQPGDLATVATTGAYSDLSGTPTINNVPAVTSSDDNKVLKSSYTGGVGSYSWENESTEVPSYTTSEDGKVLGVVNNQGTAELQWVTGGGSSTSDVYVMDGTEPFNDIWNKYKAGTVIYYWTTKPNSSSIYEPYLVTSIKPNDSANTSGTITYTCLDRQPASLLFNLYSGFSSGNANGFGAGTKNITQLTLGGSYGQTLVFNRYGHLAPATINQVPAYTTSEDGKVLGVVDNSGTASLEWITPAAGGVTDVEVDGVSVVSGGVASITMPTVDQTYNSASTDAQSGVAVAGALSTKQDTISDLATIRSGAADGATAVQPGDLATVAMSGSYNDLSNVPTILPYKPVVAGTGVRIVDDTANNRIVVEADETVLYEYTGSTAIASDDIVLSETWKHFEYIRVETRPVINNDNMASILYTKTNPSSSSSLCLGNCLAYYDSNGLKLFLTHIQSKNNTTLWCRYNKSITLGAWTETDRISTFSCRRIVGVNRIASN